MQHQMLVCIVDPSRIVRRIIGEMIQAWGYSPLCFGSGEEALTALESHGDVRALITSAELPGCSGLDLCQTARRVVGTRRPLYILFMSSSSEREKLIVALENGADDFISKPPSGEELKARLRAADRITAMQSTLAQQARTDPLTGAMNRRGFFECAGDIWRETAEGERLSGLIADLDRFKSINDGYGHAAGDEVLIAFVREAQELGFPVGRLGGEEFAILLKGPLDDAMDVAERLRRDLEEIVVQIDGQAIRPTCSIGVAESEPGDNVDSLLQRADAALFEAKRQGRNRVIAADTYRASEQHETRRGVVRTVDRSKAQQSEGQEN